MIQWQETINVLNIREHVVFRNKRIPVGRPEETESGRQAGQPQTDPAPNKSLKQGVGLGAAWLPQLRCSNRCGRLIGNGRASTAMCTERFLFFCVFFYTLKA